MKRTNELNEVLNFDGLAEAEKLTNKSYKEDKETEGLGFLATMLNQERKSDILKETQDSHNSISPKEMIELMKLEGFTKLHQKTTSRVDEWIKDSTEKEYTTQYYYWNYIDKVLAVFETWNKNTKINSAKMYYSVKVNEWSDLRGCTSSGCFDSDLKTWNGDHDIREGFRHNLNKLREISTLVNWADEDRFLWLLTYMETDIENYDYEAINKEVLSHFPEDVIKSMNVSLV